MTDKRIVIHFPKTSVSKPIVYRLVKDFGLEFNILKAEVNPKEEGLLVLELVGDDASFEKGVQYLKKEGLRVQPLSKDISMDQSRCINCSACVPLCPSFALVKDEVTGEVEFLKEKCIACGICITACPYKAMTISF